MRSTQARAVDDGSLRGGHYLKGAFFLGSKELYAWLRELDGDDYAGLVMSRVSDVNQLYGGHEELDATQRRDSRFFNTCMMATLLGAAVSDALDDGRVVSGVGGQYNFVAMAHALAGGRSVLMLRATRTHGRRVESNIRWNYGHTTIPRHLRDIYITEYGIADLRGKTDEACILAMLAISDARFPGSACRRCRCGPENWRVISACRMRGAAIRRPISPKGCGRSSRAASFHCFRSAAISRLSSVACCRRCFGSRRPPATGVAGQVLSRR